MSANALGAGGRALASGPAAPAAASPLTYVGRLTGAGSISLPSGAREIYVVATGAKNGAGAAVDVTLNGVATPDYQWGFDGGGYSPDTHWRWFTARGVGASEFETRGRIVLSPTNAIARWTDIDTDLGSAGANDYSGFLPAAALNSLAVALTLVTSIQLDVWALVAS